MIPENVDIDDLVRQLEEDSVAIGETGEIYPDMEQGLIEVVTQAEQSGFGSLGVVVLDTSPPQTADIRDVAQELLIATDIETIAVRSPGSGAVVSDTYPRASLESAQYHWLADTDFVRGIQALVDQVLEPAGPAPDWTVMSAAGGVGLIIAAGIAAFTFWRSERQVKVKSLT